MSNIQLFRKNGSKPILPPGVVVREDYSSYKFNDEVEYVGEDREGETFSCSEVADFTPDSEVRLVILPKVVVFGGLRHDDCCEDPMQAHDCDGSIESHVEASLGWSNGERNTEKAAVGRRLVEPAMAWLSGVDQDQVITDLIRAGQKHRDDEFGRSALFQMLLRLLSKEFFLDEYQLSTAMFGSSDPDVREALGPLIEFLRSSADAEKAFDDAERLGEVGDDPLAVLLEGTEAPYTVLDRSEYDGRERYRVWVPDAGALENIESAVHQELGLGQVLSRYSEGEKPAWVIYRPGEKEPRPGTFASSGLAGQALLELHTRETGIVISPEALFAAKRKAATEYAKGVISEFNRWAEGDCHVLEVAVIDRETGEVLDSECYGGYIGQDYAEEELEAYVQSEVQEHLH
jgi:hypothetical protein